MPTTPQELLLQAANKGFEYAENAQQAKADKYLLSVYEIIKEFPQIMWNHPEAWKVSKVFLYLYHYDSITNENEGITLLEKAYIYSQHTIDICKENPSDLNYKENLYQGLHTLILLLSTCSDGYETSLTYLYMQQSQTTNFKVAQALAQKILLLFTYNLLVEVDDNFENFNNNSNLETLCNTIELENPNLQVKQLEEAEKIKELYKRKCLHSLNS